MAQTYQLLRKISGKTVIGGKSAVLEAVMAATDKGAKTGRSVALYAVVGIATGVQTGTSKFEDKDEAQGWKCLVGRFQAVNQLTGEVFRSPKCFLPIFAVEDVEAQFSDDTEEVKFAYGIGAHFDEAAVTSYVYDVTPLEPPKPDDALNSLAKAVNLPLLGDDPKQTALPAGDTTIKKK